MHPTSSPPAGSVSLARLWLRLLTFRAKPEEYAALTLRHLGWGLLACWIVGAGRYWDDPRATVLQHTGLGSVIYVFVLSAVLWCVAKPLQPERISFLGINTAVAMTAPPAMLYAIPVEKWMTLEDANQLNLTFLLVVAIWRVALWIRYLRVGCGLGGWKVFLCATLPLVFIFGTLVILNLQHVVFNIMGGIREADKSSQDAAYGFLFVMTYLSLYLSGFAGIGWLITVCARMSDYEGKTAEQLAAGAQPAAEAAANGRPVSEKESTEG